jgi:hypothetical protein
MVEHNKTSIIIDTKTRDELKQIGRKNQTYDELIKELIDFKNNIDLPDRQFRGYNQASP